MRFVRNKWFEFTKLLPRSFIFLTEIILQPERLLIHAADPFEVISFSDSSFKYIPFFGCNFE